MLQISIMIDSKTYIKKKKTSLLIIFFPIAHMNPT